MNYKNQNIILRQNDTAIIEDDCLSIPGGVAFFSHSLLIKELVHNNEFEMLDHIYKLASQAFSPTAPVEVVGVGINGVSLIEPRDTVFVFSGQQYHTFDQALRSAILSLAIEQVKNTSNIDMFNRD